MTPAGVHTVSGCKVSSDPLLHELVLRFCQQVRQLTIDMSNGGWGISSSTMWITVGGTYNSTFNLFRNGPLNGTAFTAVDFRAP